MSDGGTDWGYDLGKVAADIDLGRHDGALAGLFNALRRRMGEQLAGLPWRITIAGVSFTMDDMSPLALADVEDITGRSWLSLNPEESAIVYKAVVVAHLVHDLEWDEGDVIDALRSMKGSDLVASISRDEVWPDPKGTSRSSSTTRA